MSGFQHDVAGGGGNLIIASLQSPNFESGSAGWQIAKDGSAQFNDVTVRGTFQAENTYLLSNGIIVGYSAAPAANNLAWSSNPLSESYTDGSGNVILPGLTSYSGDAANGYSATQLQALTDNTSPFIAFYQSATMSDWGSATAIAGNPDSAAANLVFAGQAGGFWMAQTGMLSVANPASTGSPETWHDVTLDSGWTNADTLRYKLLVQDNAVWVQGAVTHAAFTAATDICSSNPLPAAYRPTGTHNIGGTGIPGRAGAEITSAGVIIAEPNGTSCTECDINGMYPLN